MKNQKLIIAVALMLLLLCGTSSYALMVEVEDWSITVNPVPEPTTMILLGTCLIVIAVIGRKKFKK